MRLGTSQQIEIKYTHFYHQLNVKKFKDLNQDPSNICEFSIALFEISKHTFINYLILIGKSNLTRVDSVRVSYYVDTRHALACYDTREGLIFVIFLYFIFLKFYFN